MKICVDQNLKARVAQDRISGLQIDVFSMFLKILTSSSFRYHLESLSLSLSLSKFFVVQKLRLIIFTKTNSK